MHCTIPARTEPALHPGKTKARVPSGVTEQDCRACQQLGSGTSRARASSPAGTEPLHLLLAKPSPHKAPETRPLTNHRGEDAGNALSLYSLPASLYKVISASSSSHNAAQQFRFPGKVCTQIYAGKRKGCSKGCTRSGNIEDFHPQPHTTLTGGSDAPLKCGFEVP